MAYCILGAYRQKHCLAWGIIFLISWSHQVHYFVFVKYTITKQTDWADFSSRWRSLVTIEHSTWHESFAVVWFMTYKSQGCASFSSVIISNYNHINDILFIPKNRSISLLSSPGPSFPTLPSPSSALVTTGLFSASLKSTLNFYVWVTVCGICLSLPDLLHFIWWELLMLCQGCVWAPGFPAAHCS